ncbi:MAG: Mu-like prophage major head subunit gpT family protein [Desulfobacterales bacterium]|nr:Mu-like prophage major head subunit gpT family protein [Desulfobacterales bacterium]
MATVITAPVLQALMVGFSRKFQEGQSMAKSQYLQVATKLPSGGKSTTYGWLGKWPKFREWVGDRVINDMAAHGYSVVNKAFESTIGVGRDEIEDDEIGVYSPLFQEMGLASEVFPDEMVFPMLDAGLTGECYDGQYFFDIDHPVYPNADGTGTAVSVPNYIDGANPAWFLLDTTRPLKPLIYQERRPIQFTSMNKPTDTNVFMSKEYYYGVDCRANAGYGLWQMAFCSKAALDPDNIWEAYQAMKDFKADGGKSLGIRPNLLVVRSGQEKLAEEVMKEIKAGGETNTLHGKFDLLVPDWM